MAKASPAFHNFTAGELSPRLEGRTDVSKYFNGCSTLNNFIVHPHGGASRRSGTIYVAEVKDSSKETRLIPFEFSVTQNYILEFGNLYFRIIKDGGVVIASTKTATAMTKANPVVVTSNAHGFSDGDSVKITNVVGMTEVNNKEYVVANKTTNTFELSGVDGTSYTTYASGGTLEKIAEVTTPYLTAELDEIKFTQSADIMYLAHPLHAVQKITRTSHTDWTCSQVEFRRGPVMDDNDTDDTLTANARTGTVTITASTDTFVSTDVGRLIKIHDGFAEISGINSSCEI